MEEDALVLGNKTYSLLAPLMIGGNDQSESSATTETAIGILCACITLSVILLFLWKFVKQKQQSMISNLQDKLSNVEKGKSTRRTGRNPEPLQSMTSLQSDSSVSLQDERAHESAKNKHVSNRKQDPSKNHKDKKDNFHKKNPSLSLRKRLSTRSTAHSLKDYRCFTELESSDGRDMLLSLKDERVAIRDRISRRNEAVQKASRYLEECASVVAALKKSVRDVISKDHKKNGKKSMKRVKSVTVELSSKYLYPYDPAIRWTVKSKDSFDSLQCCLQGLRSHGDAQGSLQDLAILREGHRMENEREIKQKCSIAKTTSAIWECRESIRQAKDRMKELDEKNVVSLLRPPITKKNRKGSKELNAQEKSYKVRAKKHFVTSSTKVYPEQPVDAGHDRSRAMSKSANALNARKRRANAAHKGILSKLSPSGHQKSKPAVKND